MFEIYEYNNIVFQDNEQLRAVNFTGGLLKQASPYRGLVVRRQE